MYPRKNLIAQALEPVTKDRGIDYSVTSFELDVTSGRKNLHPVKKTERCIQPGGEQTLSLKIARHNDEHRPLPKDCSERDAVRSINELLTTSKANELGSDLAIKVFKDLDAVFFDGMLFTHTSVRWAADMPDGVLGHARSREEDAFTCAIELNARNCWTPGQYVAKEDMALNMFQTLLHEMAHAIFLCYCHTGLLICEPHCKHRASDDCGHGPAFRMVLHSIERRARRLGWFPSIVGRKEDLRNGHPMSVHYCGPQGT